MANNPHLKPNQDGILDFQSDKYQTCPTGKVPLSTSAPMAQDLLAEYAQRRQSVDMLFSEALLRALDNRGYEDHGDGN